MVGLFLINDPRVFLITKKSATLNSMLLSICNTFIL